MSKRKTEADEIQAEATERRHEEAEIEQEDREVAEEAAEISAEEGAATVTTPVTSTTTCPACGRQVPTQDVAGQRSDAVTQLVARHSVDGVECPGTKAIVS